jgi:hypothetical protein
MADNMTTKLQLLPVATEVLVAATVVYVALHYMQPKLHSTTVVTTQATVTNIQGGHQQN